MQVLCNINGMTNVLVDTDSLEHKTTRIEDDNSVVEAVEYYSDGVLVHRSANVTMKVGLMALMENGSFA